MGMILITRPDIQNERQVPPLRENGEHLKRFGRLAAAGEGRIGCSHRWLVDPAGRRQGRQQTRLAEPLRKNAEDRQGGASLLRAEEPGGPIGQGQGHPELESSGEALLRYPAAARLGGA